jgi:hypothetical protein
MCTWVEGISPATWSATPMNPQADNSK